MVYVCIHVYVNLYICVHTKKILTCIFLQIIHFYLPFSYESLLHNAKY